MPITREPLDLVPAPLGRRIAARLIDGTISTVVVYATFGLVALVGSAATNSASAGAAVTALVGLAVLPLVASIAWTVWYVGLESRGVGPGKRLMGLEVVRAASGQYLGKGQVFGRLVVLGLIGSLTCGIGTLVMLLLAAGDATSRGRMWHDRACDSIVIDARATPTRSSTPSLLARWDSPAEASSAAPVTAAVGVTPVRAPVAAPPPPPPQSAPLPPLPPSPLQEAAVALQPQPVRAPAPPAGPPPAPVVRQERRAGLVTVVPGAVAPVAHAVPHPGAEDRVAPEDQDAEGDEDATRLHARRPGGWYLLLPDGRPVAVEGRVLLGRAPQPRAGEPPAECVVVPDPTRRVSKTHLLLEAVGGELRAHDRGSTNGTLVRHGSGDERALTAEEAVVVRAGDVLSLGGVEVRVAAGQASAARGERSPSTPPPIGG